MSVSKQYNINQYNLNVLMEIILRLHQNYIGKTFCTAVRCWLAVFALYSFLVTFSQVGLISVESFHLNLKRLSKNDLELQISTQTQKHTHT